MLIVLRILGVRHSGNDVPDKKLIASVSAFPSDGKLPEVICDANITGEAAEEINATIVRQVKETCAKTWEKETAANDKFIFFGFSAGVEAAELEAKDAK